MLRPTEWIEIIVNAGHQQIHIITTVKNSLFI